jgi:hypothetical protein
MNRFGFCEKIVFLWLFLLAFLFVFFFLAMRPQHGMIPSGPWESDTAVGCFALPGPTLRVSGISTAPHPQYLKGNGRGVRLQPRFSPNEEHRLACEERFLELSPK